MTSNKIAKINKEYHYFNHLAKVQGKKYLSVKDCICVQGMPTTAGSKMLDGYLPRLDATCVARLKKAGYQVLGKTAQDAFGFGSFSVNVGLGKDIPLNPFDKKRTCGGSSGGAAGFTQICPEDLDHVALGESTGGSIACPAAFCGVVGFTPTYGRVSRWGQIDYASSLDKIGPIARTVKECAEVLEIISGSDNRDATCLDKPTDFTKFLGKNPQQMKIGLIKEGFGKGVDSKIAESVWEAVKNLGVEVKEVSLPLTMKYGVSTYYLLSMTEASTNLAKLCGLRYGQEENPEGISFNKYFTQVRSKNFNSETKRRILLGTFARMAGYRDAYYMQAAKIRTLIIKEYQDLFKKFDIIISPTMPIVAPTFKEIEKLTPMQNYMMDVLTVGPNLAGLPHVSIPCGTKDGLPIGMLLISDHWEERKLIALGDYYEKLRDKA